MEAWLKNQLQWGQPFEGEALEYVLGRAGKLSTLKGIGLANWLEPKTAAPDKSFRERYGPTGARLNGSFMIPFWSPRGDLLGIQFQKPDSRWMQRYTLPRSSWNPLFFGLYPKTMQEIWEGASIWLVEGFFDLTALEWALPEGHVVLCCMTAKLSDAQAEFIRRFASQVYIAFDMDAIGKGASVKALRKLEALGVSAQKVTFRGGKDPGDIWDLGGEYAVRNAFQEFVPVI